MGKSSPKKPDSLKKFQGLTTSAFSLQRQTPASTTAGTPSRAVTAGSSAGFFTDPGGDRQSQLARGIIPGTPASTTPASGPFQLTRTDPFVPNKESELFRLLEQNRQGIGGLFGNIASTRGQLEGQQGRAAGLFDETGRLRENLSELAGEVRPGFGRLTEAALTTAKNRFNQEAGNLRQVFQDRNLQGSSFALAEQSRLNQTFEEEEFALRSQAFVQEIDLRRQIVGDAGKLLELDQQTLGVQAQQVGLQLGLNEQQANVFRDEMVNLQQQQQLLGQRISRELNELGISGNIVNEQQAIAADLFRAEAELAAGEAAGFGSAVGAVAGAIGGALISKSDRRLKRDIVKIDQLSSGLNVYVFRYLWSPLRYIGVMADEVLKVNPSAVIALPSGDLAVDYARL